MQMQAYVDALARDIIHMGKKTESDNVIVDSVYFGGGTPSLLPKKDIEYLTDTIYEAFRVTEDAEFTFEVNPATLDRAKAKSLYDSGINRLSIGMQSAHDNELEALSRVHNLREFVNCYKIARKAGFTNINVDVMYGIPEQTLESFMQTLEVVCDLKPEHISMYGLRIEEGTPFSVYRSELVLPGEDEEYSMFRQGRSYLKEQGYTHYEISNFAREGYESKHNMKYWRCEEYIGIGVAAHSFYNGVRYARITDTDRYISYICGEEGDRYEDTVVASSVENIGERELEVEYVMLGMRTSRGVVKADYERKFGIDFDEKYSNRIREYADAGFIINTEKKCRFSAEGMYVSNRILADILDL
jgi:oxygen-independent coproporphyrinogen-3 oxidase